MDWRWIKIFLMFLALSAGPAAFANVLHSEMQAYCMPRAFAFMDAVGGPSDVVKKQSNALDRLLSARLVLQQSQCLHEYFVRERLLLPAEGAHRIHLAMVSYLGYLGNLEKIARSGIGRCAALENPGERGQCLVTQYKIIWHCQTMHHAVAELANLSGGKSGRLLTFTALFREQQSRMSSILVKLEQEFQGGS